MHKLTAISSALALMGVSQLVHATTQSDLLAAQQCAALKEAKIYDTQIIKIEWLPAGELPQDKNAAMSGASAKPVTAGAHCIVTGEIEKRIGVNGKPYAIGFQLRLPEQWNKKFLFQGGGGTNGVVSPAIGKTPVRGSDALPALSRGYAVVSTDSGHGGGSRDTSFSEDQLARFNYALASTGKVTAVAKQLIEQMYQTKPSKSFFMGCSNGGREAMQAAMRYPQEFDGVVAGNPGFRLSRAAVAEAWDNQHFLKYAPTNKKGEKIVANALTQADLDVVVKGVLKQCDAKDGLADGIINAWEQCDFKPEMVKAELGERAEQKVALLNAIFGGAKNSRGENVYASWPYDAGLNTNGWRVWKHGSSQTAEPNAINFTMGVKSLAQYFMTPHNPAFDTLTFDFDKDVAKTAEIAGVNDADETDLSYFQAKGGKMIIFEGVSDPVFSAHDLRDWYNQLQANMKDVQGFARVFMVPGMNHCGMGPATENFDPLTALEQWTDEGKAPDFILAKAGPEMSNKAKEMPLCPYPKIATYVGGDENKATSFECK
ncbi:tannase/feruloyl esterase family alpha/beta hydrolase [Actinobacillus equuli]|uniref:tannase/feruloyl esterase family alpha/beta hydrolase n=1 Tax=Actinobacillus equuli TaxID=718 RepID=UPI0024411428|nr:tannase/feruloyl esterase family alpha/beta hydrolase [Actinobacillus equuli]WGE79085.1 tannase/feruloyl esterase family alpha/beta hydrolase [Actinobacillus equuli subsp. equuli]